MKIIKHYSKNKKKILIKESPPKIASITTSSISTQYKPILPLSLPTGIVYYALQLNQNSQSNSSQAPLFFIPGDSAGHVSLPSVIAPGEALDRSEDIPTALNTVQASLPDFQRPEDIPNDNIPSCLSPETIESPKTLKSVEKMGEELRITIPNRTAPIVFPDKDSPTPLITPTGIFTPSGDVFPPLITPFSALGTPQTPTFNNPNF